MKKYATLLGTILLGLASALGYAPAPITNQLPSSAVPRASTGDSHVTVRGIRQQFHSPILNQLGALTASDGWSGDNLGGWGVAIDGNTAVAGGLGLTGSGGAYVFVEPSAGWADMTQTAKLIPSDGSSIGSVGISGTTVVGSGTSGTAYVFVEPAAGWADMTETARLTASNGDALTSVAISGNTVIAVAGSGAAYVFIAPPSGWANMTETAMLTTSNGDVLTGSVAISGSTAVAGAVWGNNGNGAAYVFVEPAGGWASETETAELTASDGAFDDFLGCSVGISGDTVVAGAPNHEINGNGWQGAVYVFAVPTGGWANMTQTAELTASDGGFTDQLGNGAAIYGDTVVGGAPQYEPFGNTGHGKAYAYFKRTGGWTNMTESEGLVASGGETCDALGVWVAISNGTALAGAPRTCAVGGGSAKQGTAYVFGVCSTASGVALCPGTLTFETQLIRTASTPQTITLTNSGSATLNITSIDASANFIRRNNCGSSVAVGASCNITVGFLPQGIGTLTGAVTITDNAPNSPQTVSLSGVGTAVTLLPPSLDFGKEPVGTTSPPQTVTFTNYADRALSIHGIRIAGGGTQSFAQTNTCGTSVPAGGSCTISVTFTPMHKYAIRATLEVYDNGGANPQTVALSGTGM